MSGGGSDVEGAPDFYYEQLVESGEQETEWTGEFMNFYKTGNFAGSTAKIDAIETVGASTSLDSLKIEAPPGAPQYQFDLEFDGNGMPVTTMGSADQQYYQHPETGETTTDINRAQKWVDEYNQSNPQAYQVGGQTFGTYDEAAEYAYANGIAERPTSYAAMEQAQIASNMELIPLQTEAEKLRLQEEKDVLEQRAPALRQYFAEAGNVDPNSWANRAQADVAQQFGVARDQAGANIARTGAVPGAGRMGAIQSDMATHQAKATAGARTTARRAGEQERFNRLGQAIQVSNQF